MISINEVIAIHEILIDIFGGTPGLRDLDALEAAIGRAHQTFDSIDLHPTVVLKAAATMESLIVNHPFVDGNKRIGYAIMLTILAEESIDIVATTQQKYDFVMTVARGDMEYQHIASWISSHQH